MPAQRIYCKTMHNRIDSLLNEIQRASNMPSQAMSVNDLADIAIKLQTELRAYWYLNQEIPAQ